ncbi:MAG: DUF6152 family protein [Steroidobacteraceae bacterium]
MKSSLKQALLCAGLMLSATAAFAHHSAAAFDRTKPVVLIGTVKKFLWSNPHTWIYLTVPDGKGGNDEWTLEGPPLGMMMQAGWNGKTVRTGDKLRVLIAPYRDGTKHGEFMVVRDSTGKQLKF